MNRNKNCKIEAVGFIPKILVTGVLECSTEIVRESLPDKTYNDRIVREYPSVLTNEL